MPTPDDGADLLRAWMAVMPDVRTQAEIARLIGAQAPSVSQWLARKARPSTDFRIALRDLAGIPETAWMNGRERARRAKAAKAARRAAA